MLIRGDLKAQSNWKLGVVTSRFNEEITGPLESGALNRLGELGVEINNIVRVQVPGAVEIPLAAKRLLAMGCDAVLALGAVIRGETTHYDYVCNSVERGCSQLMLEMNKPVVFGVLTTENEAQALDRLGGQHGHKGRDAADTAIEMLSLLNKMKELNL